jgi:hypothetical protein
MSIWLNRVLVFGAFAAAIAAACFAVASALHHADRPPLAAAEAAQATVSAGTVRFGHDRVVTTVKPGGLACIRVLKGSSTVAKACFGALAPQAIVYASSKQAIGGRAGPQVKAVIVRLTGKRTVWAQLERGAFYTTIPKGRRATNVVKVLTNGTRTSFTVSQ